MERLCLTSGGQGAPKIKNQGSGGAETGIWLIFIILVLITAGLMTPLLIIPFGYSLYRFFAKKDEVCPFCGDDRMIPLDSPIAKDRLKLKD